MVSTEGGIGNPEEAEKHPEKIIIHQSILRLVCPGFHARKLADWV